MSTPTTNTQTELEALRVDWLSDMKHGLINTGLPKYSLLVRTEGTFEQQREAIEVMLRSVEIPSRHNTVLYTEIVRLAAIEGLGLAVFRDSLFRKQLCIAITLFADTLLPFDYDEIDQLAIVFRSLTGIQLNTDNLMTDNYALTRKVTDMFYGKIWSDLVLSDWTLDTLDAEKLAILLAAPLLPAWSTRPECLGIALPDSLAW